MRALALELAREKQRGWPNVAGRDLSSTSLPSGGPNRQVVHWKSTLDDVSLLSTGGKASNQPPQQLHVRLGHRYSRSPTAWRASAICA
jgi:hypothetical protein